MNAQQRWRDAKPGSFWLADRRRPPARAQLDGQVDADLLIVGGGLVGLWSGIQALERDPSQCVVLVEGDRIGSGASGRNGGFCAASLTHGDPNGRARWPKEMPLLRELGKANLSAIIETIDRYDIDCDLEKTGQLDVAVASWQRDQLRAEYEILSTLGEDVEFLDEKELSREISSPIMVAGLLDPTSQVLLDPARLTWGLADAFESLGGLIFEHTEIAHVKEVPDGLHALCTSGSIRARSCIGASGAFKALSRKARDRIVPVYDYVLTTEPLTSSQLSSLGWNHRRGIADAGNQFHYLRLTSDNRVLFGGYDAVYRYNQRVDPRFDQDPTVFSVLEEHFDAMFPELRGVSFAYRWGGAIDTSTRFAASLISSHGGKLITVNGFTGLGVGASRFFALAALDRLRGTSSPITNLSMVRKTAIPFPPEPLRFLGISLTRRSIARADHRDGKRDLWLRLLDRLGLGFDS
jgi:glycine/D-amino acid oxidase-like deaminating enzyme